MDEHDAYNIEKNKIVIVQKWNKHIHGSTGNLKFDNYFDTKNLVITTFDDEYDTSSDSDIIDFINYWSEHIANFNLSGMGYFNNPNLNPTIALADTYIYKGYCFAIDKTYLIIRLQRKWRTYYNELMKQIKIRKQTRSIIFREVFGKYPTTKI